MRDLLNSAILAVIFVGGLLIGMMLSTPGKGESLTILQKHGDIELEEYEYLIYTPDNAFMSTEEYEALAVVSALYEHIAINLN
ncbi:MAG: hypothetical protein KAH32_08955 [Chlamydiia bacterium]|nr:hypothetical protein [Chlamydiia bacterium]